MYETIIIDGLFKEFKSNSNEVRQNQVKAEQAKFEIPVFSFEHYKKDFLEKSQLKSEKRAHKAWLETNPVLQPDIKFQTMAGRSIKQILGELN